MINQPGKLACVTGASSGIGKSYATLLASQGYDLLLVARRQELLQALAADLSARYGIHAEALPLDLTAADNSDRLASRLAASPNLGVLVNSAGYGTAAYFNGSTLEDQMGMAALHVSGLVRLVHAALGPMLRQGSGVIVNVASLVAFFQVPTVAVYAASKRFMVDFSQSLAMEILYKGVHVQALCPGLTRSEMHGQLSFDTSIFPAFAWMTSDQVAAASWKAARSHSGVCIPGGVNKAVYAVTRLIPGWLQRSLLLRLEPLLLPYLKPAGTA